MTSSREMQQALLLSLFLPCFSLSLPCFSLSLYLASLSISPLICGSDSRDENGTLRVETRAVAATSWGESSDQVRGIERLGEWKEGSKERERSIEKGNL